MNTASLKQDYKQRIVPALKEKFGYSTVMQVPVLEKIVINQGLGEAVADKKVIEIAINELTAIAFVGQEFGHRHERWLLLPQQFYLPENLRSNQVNLPD